MLELISDKTVIFFDVGYTIDYPASDVETSFMKIHSLSELL